LRSTRGKVVAALVACALVIGGLFAFGANRGSSTKQTSGKPERALGANSDGDPGTSEGDQVATGEAPVPVVGEAVTPFLNTPKLEAPAVTPWVKRELTRDTEETDAEEQQNGEIKPAVEGAEVDLSQGDGALQTSKGAGTMPAPLFNKPGLRDPQNPGRQQWTPPDTNGDIGNGYYVQMVNVVFGVYDADTGKKLKGPLTVSSLFTGSGLCSKHDDGDPVTVYDPINNRFLVTQFALDLKRDKFAECIAISLTGDPTGAWYAYQFDYPKAKTFNDYPKFGVWPGSYFASFNQFDGKTFAWRGAGAVAYEQSAMLTGAPARQIYMDLYATDPYLGGMLPSDLDGAALPSGVNPPNLYAQFDPTEFGPVYQQDQLELWQFTPDWTTPANSAFEPLYSNVNDDAIKTAAFNPFICGKTTFSKGCVPQKKSDVKLDTLADRLMYRLQYRNDGVGNEHLVLSHAVKSPKGSGERYYVLKGTSTATQSWSIEHQGTYAPTGTKYDYRWMGSAAMDGNGNLAIGYSLGGKGTYAAIGYAGRTAAAPNGKLNVGERVAFKGKGAEKGKYNRWGDYSNLTIDPADDCTFYYTTEYYRKTNQWGWATQIMKFRFPGC
jgi:hypothetical protein